MLELQLFYKIISTSTTTKSTNTFLNDNYTIEFGWYAADNTVYRGIDGGGCPLWWCIPITRDTRVQFLVGSFA